MNPSEYHTVGSEGVGEVKGSSFMKLMEMLVESVLYCMGQRYGGVEGS